MQMNEDENPYQPVLFQSDPESQTQSDQKRIDRFAMIAWPVVFGLNLILPWFLSLGLTQRHGRFGVEGALAVLLVCSWSLCYLVPYVARRLIFGSIFTALTQLFPVVQIYAGVIAISLAKKIGMMNYDDDMQLGSTLSETGGFVVTTIVGGIILGFAFVSGALLTFILPARWFLQSNKNPLLDE